MTGQPITTTALWCQEAQTVHSPEYLLTFLLNGSAELRGPEPLPLEAGTLLFLSPFSERRLHLPQGCRVIYAVIPSVLLEEYVGIPKRASVVLLPDGTNTAKEKLIELFDLQYNTQDGTALEQMRVTFELLSALQPVISNLPPEETDVATKEERTSRIAAYMEAHFREPIQLGDLAEAFSLSKQHLSLIFHQEFGVPFLSYLQNLRLNEAERLLLTTEDTITAIGENSGFPNLKSFNQTFRQRHGISPKEFRKSHAATLPSVTIPSEHTLENVNQLLSPYRLVYQKSDEPVSATEQVSVKIATPFQPKWNDILNIDNTAECLHSTVQATLEQLQQELHFRYVRLCNFYNQELTPYIAPLKQHRFNHLCRVIDFFQKLDMLPMLNFGDTYQVMLDSIMVSDGAYSVSQTDFLEMLENMLRAFISRWGSEWVGRWRFEFHMPETLYGKEDPAGFLALFEESFHLIRSYLPNAEIGGPSLPMDAAHMPRWQFFMEGIQARSIPVDFISAELWGDYTQKVDYFSGQFGESQATRTIERLHSVDITTAIQKVGVLKSQMEKQALSCKLYISAMGVTKYQATPAQVAGHCAAHLVKLNMELQSLVDGIGVWKALNSEAEYPNESGALGTGCGLVSRYDLKNINYYAYRFLSQLLPVLLFHGLHCTVTSDGSDRFSILIHNCKKYSDYFCRHYLDGAALRYWDNRLYTGSAVLRQNLHITGVTPQNYLVKQYLIGDRHGCIAAVIQEMGEFQQNTADEIAYIAGQSMPYQHTFRVEADDTLQLSLTLQPNEVMLLCIEPEHRT